MLVFNTSIEKDGKKAVVVTEISYVNGIDKIFKYIHENEISKLSIVDYLDKEKFMYLLAKLMSESEAYNIKEVDLSESFRLLSYLGSEFCINSLAAMIENNKWIEVLKLPVAYININKEQRYSLANNLSCALTKNKTLKKLCFGSCHQALFASVLKADASFTELEMHHFDEHNFDANVIELFKKNKNLLSYNVFNAYHESYEDDEDYDDLGLRYFLENLEEEHGLLENLANAIKINTRIIYFMNDVINDEIKARQDSHMEPMQIKAPNRLNLIIDACNFNKIGFFKTYIKLWVVFRYSAEDIFNYAVSCYYNYTNTFIKKINSLKYTNSYSEKLNTFSDTSDLIFFPANMSLKRCRKTYENSENTSDDENNTNKYRRIQ